MKPHDQSRASSVKTVLWLVLSGFMLIAGLGHFTHFSLYMAFMPKWMPMGAELVYLSGVVEISLALALLWRPSTKLAAWGLVAALIAMSLANINHAFRGGIEDSNLPDFFADPMLAWIRLPLQLVFIAWAWWYTRDPVPRLGLPSSTRDPERRA